MGQAKDRGLREFRVAQALAGNSPKPMPKKMSAGERDALVREAVMDTMHKIMGDFSKMS